MVSIKPGQKIIVLRQSSSTQIEAEEVLSRRMEEVAQAASMLSARAARDIDAGGRRREWGDWGQGRRQGRGAGPGRDQGLRGQATQRDTGPRVRPSGYLGINRVLHVGIGWCRAFFTAGEGRHYHFARSLAQRINTCSDRGKPAAPVNQRHLE